MLRWGAVGAAAEQTIKLRNSVISVYGHMYVPAYCLWLCLIMCTFPYLLQWYSQVLLLLESHKVQPANIYK